MQTPVTTRCNNKREGKRRLLEVTKRFLAQSVVIQVYKRMFLSERIKLYMLISIAFCMSVLRP